MSIKLRSNPSLLVLTAMAVAIAFGPVAVAGTVAPGFTTNTLAANDDGSTSLIGLPYAINYFGSTYTGLYVNNNGNVTFSSAMSTYTPSGLGSSYSGQPIIAPFFGDVDTRGAGSGLTSYGTGTYAGHTAFGVTWPDVGYYPSQSDLLNTFQLIMVERSDTGAGNFDFYFNYDQIQWESGSASGGSGGLGGTSAAAGFNAGQLGNPAGTYYQLPGSLVNGALLDGGPDSLVTHTNDNVPGQFLFQVRNGQVIRPPTEVPEPSSLTMFLLGLFGVVGFGVLRRRPV